jgi:hypothetical protein
MTRLQLVEGIRPPNLSMALFEIVIDSLQRLKKSTKSDIWEFVRQICRAAYPGNFNYSRSANNCQQLFSDYHLRQSS